MEEKVMYFIVERYDCCNSIRLVFSSNSLEETVKAWYKLLEDKDLYSSAGWCDQAIIVYKDDKFILTGGASENDGKYFWNLHTYNEDTKYIYDYAVNETPSYYSKVEEYKKNQNDYIQVNLPF